MIDLRSDDNNKLPSWSEWRPAHAATCRKGGCAALATDGSEWCDKHLEDLSAQRAAVAAGALPDREMSPEFTVRYRHG